MLDAGIVGWADVKSTLNATTRRPASYLADRLRVLEDLWLQVGETFAVLQFLEQRGCAGRGPEIIAKYASVSLFGLWARREQFRYTWATSSSDEDARSSANATVSATPGTPYEKGSPIFRDFVIKQKVLTLTSMRPLHERCLEEERLQLARACLLHRRWSEPK
jgi:hypothetical protein